MSEELPYQEKFWLVANSMADQGQFGDYLIRPPRYIQTSEKSAEQAAYRLAQQTGGEFVVLEAKARIVIENGAPKWIDLG